jgi:hypothetical protein
VVLASLSGAGVLIVLGAWLALCLLIFVVSPRDVNGRRRATGCVFGLAIFFGLIVVALVSWASDAIF